MLITSIYIVGKRLHAQNPTVTSVRDVLLIYDSSNPAGVCFSVAFMPFAIAARMCQYYGRRRGAIRCRNTKNPENSMLDAQKEAEELVEKA
jgi:hypothetical protein